MRSRELRAASLMNGRGRRNAVNDERPEPRPTDALVPNFGVSRGAKAREELSKR